MKSSRLVVIEGVRTPFARMGTLLSSLGADELGRVVVNALLSRTGIDPAVINEVIFGCVAQPPEAANLARVISLRSGIPQHVPAITVHRNCASGFEAFTQAQEKMIAGRGDIFIVGGTESMSKIPLYYSEVAARKFARLIKAKTPIQKVKSLLSFRLTDFQPRIGLKLGLTDPVCGLNMGETAELLAREYGISREKQDAFAIESHTRAIANQSKFREEICPVFIGEGNLRGETGIVENDNGPRDDQTPETLSKLKPVFDRNFGTVTAANSSQITDGAVALLVMSEAKAEQLGLEPMGALTAYGYAGCDPMRMGLGPVYAMSKVEKASGLSPEQADIVEINEAFAAQVLAVLACLRSDEFARLNLGRSRYLAKIEKDKLNVNGGAIALGHPVGATGARLVLTSLKELARRKAKRALISLCVGGGQGAAIWLERL